VLRGWRNERPWPQGHHARPIRVRLLLLPVDIRVISVYRFLEFFLHISYGALSIPDRRSCELDLDLLCNAAAVTSGLCGCALVQGVLLVFKAEAVLLAMVYYIPRPFFIGVVKHHT
jgi:hypothetical protein